jgi:nitroreductase
MKNDRLVNNQSVQPNHPVLSSQICVESRTFAASKHVAMRYNLSEITDIIKDRRTIYPEQFSERKVHREQIEKILNNAIWAPTHGNTQPWRFKVFLDEGKVKLSDFMANWYLSTTPQDQFNEKKFTNLRERPLKSSVVIAVCMERQPEEKISELDELLAVGCTVQNMHLTCTAYGLGGFWATPNLIRTVEMSEFLGLKPKDKCLCLFYIGYPQIEWPKAHRKPIEYVTEWIQD